MKYIWIYAVIGLVIYLIINKPKKITPQPEQPTPGSGGNIVPLNPIGINLPIESGQVRWNPDGSGAYVPGLYVPRGGSIQPIAPITNNPPQNIAY